LKPGQRGFGGGFFSFPPSCSRVLRCPFPPSRLWPKSVMEFFWKGLIPPLFFLSFYLFFFSLFHTFFCFSFPLGTSPPQRLLPLYGFSSFHLLFRFSFSPPHCRRKIHLVLSVMFFSPCPLLVLLFPFKQELFRLLFPLFLRVFPILSPFFTIPQRAGPGLFDLGSSGFALPCTLERFSTTL